MFDFKQRYPENKKKFDQNYDKIFNKNKEKSMAKCPDCGTEMEPKEAGKYYCHACQVEWFR